MHSGGQELSIYYQIYIINLLIFAKYKKLNLTLLPYKNILYSLSPLHENKNEVDKETFKAEKTAALHILDPKDTVQTN